MRSKNKLILASILALSLIGCGPSGEVVSSEVRVYEITEVRQPKHFYVSLRDVQTGRVFNDVYISKHCSHWRNAIVGTQWKFREVRYKYGESDYRTDVVEYGDFCDTLSSW